MLGNYFEFSQRGTSIKREIMAGITTFLTMSYIVIVNPLILSDGTGMDLKALVIVTCLTAAIGTFLIGLWANLPLAMAPGMGMNAFFTYSLVIGEKIPWQQALGIVFISAIIFLLLTLFKVRTLIVNAIPESLKHAIPAGIGLFIAFIGMKSMGLIIPNEATIVHLGKFNLQLLLGIFSFVIICIFEMKRIRGGIFLGIALTTILGLIFDKNIMLPKQILSVTPSIAPIFMKLDIVGAFKLAFIGPIFSFTFIHLFDSLGTILACGKAAGLIDENGEATNMGKALEAESVGAITGSLLGTSTSTIFLESGAGIAEGAKTGFTSITVAVLFLLSIFFTPIISIVPAYATAPALIIVGIYMFKNLLSVDLSKLDVCIPAFLTVVLIPLTYSISIGISFGFISYTLIELFLGKYKNISLVMWIITILSIVNLSLI